MPPEQTDVLIVGSGPAGLAAAVELRRLGAGRVSVIEREAEPGGVPRLCHHTGFGLRDLRWLHSGPSYAGRYVRQAQAAGVEWRLSTTITGWQSPDTLAYASPRGPGAIQARAILLATGCRERPRAARLVPGDRPPGIFTTGSLQRFVYQERLPLGRRAVIVGAEIVSLSALLTLMHAGVATAAMITDLPRHQIYFPYLPMKWALADVLTRTPLIASARVAGITGKQRVQAVEIERAPDGRRERIACDTVVFTGDWIPEHALARLGGLRLDPGTRGPAVDGHLRASARGVFAAGNLLRGAEIADVCALEGRRAAQAIAGYLQDGAWPAQAIPIEAAPPIAWVFPNVISPGAAAPRALAFQVSRFCRDVEVVAAQGGQPLHVQRYGRLGPNTSARLDGAWLSRAAGHDGSVRLTLRAAG